MSEISLKEKNDLIIKAARERFAHYGYSKVTMDEIAADVEMGKASLYYYFPTKEELFKAVIATEQSEFTDEIETMLQKQISAGQKLHEYVNQRLKHFQSLVNLGMLSVHSLLDMKSIFKKSFRDFEIQELMLLQKIIDEGKIKKEFSPHLTNKVAKVFLHILQGLRFRALRQIKGRSLDNKEYRHLQEEMKIITEIFIEGIRN